MKQVGDAIHVVAAVLRRKDGKILVTSRPAGKSLAGYFEFPGGKVESNEDSRSAICRELLEELGITVKSARPLIKYPYRYGLQLVQLEFWYSESFSGKPVPHEGQEILWKNVEELHDINLLPADYGVTTALLLPSTMVITPQLDGDRKALLDGLDTLFSAGYRMVQFRQHGTPAEKVLSMLRDAVELAKKNGADLVANCDAEIAQRAGCENLHLPAAKLLELESKPAGFRWVSASIHDKTELLVAQNLGLDFALLGPVCETSTHPGVVPLGWDNFSKIVESAAIPVYALGGLRVDELTEAWNAGAQGVAGISGFWPAT